MIRKIHAYDYVKRGIDIVFSVFLLIVLVPVFAGVTVIVLMSMGRPVLFRQQRPGKDGCIFWLHKFRTMKVCKRSGVEAVDTDTARLTRAGSVLRKLSLDELPELWNILRGDMSFIGPRPLLVEYLSLYNLKQARRHEVRPGLTGLAQVNGRNELDWPARFELDVHYVDNRSFLLDASILVKTIGTVFGRKGVSAAGSATMKPFTGEDG